MFSGPSRHQTSRFRWRAGIAISCAAALLTTLVASSASAQPTPAPAAPIASDTPGARPLFDKALALAKAYRHFEACALMEQSYALEASYKTKYWLARCKTTIGNLASAATIYRELIDELKAKAARSGIADQEKQAHQQRLALVESDLAGFSADIPKMRVEVPANVRALPALSLTRNGTPIGQQDWTKPWPLDPGNYAIAANAEGYAPWSSVHAVTNGRDVTVKVPMLRELEAASEEDPGAVQRTLGWSSGGLGIAGLTAGGVVAIVAKLQYDGSLDGCDNVGCNASSREQQQAATLKADVATGLLLGGGVFAATGLVLLLTAPEAEVDAVDVEDGAAQGDGSPSPLKMEAALSPAGLVLRGRW